MQINTDYTTISFSLFLRVRRNTDIDRENAIITSSKGM